MDAFFVKIEKILIASVLPPGNWRITVTRIKALKSITPLLQVKDLDHSIDYYVAKLGFKLHFRDRGFAGLFRTVDTLWQEFRAAGASMHEYLDSGPVNREYGIRDFSVYDPDGYNLVFGAEIE